MGVIVVATDGSDAATAALDAGGRSSPARRATTIAVITVWQALQGDFGLVFPSGAPLEALLDRGAPARGGDARRGPDAGRGRGGGRARHGSPRATRRR